MRLRPRNSTGENQVEGGGIVKKGIRTRTTKTVLGDISNRNNGGNNENIKNKKTQSKKERKTIHFEDSEQQEKPKPRRSSARLQELREKENQQQNSNCSTTTSISVENRNASDELEQDENASVANENNGDRKQNKKRSLLKSVHDSLKPREVKAGLSRRQGKKRRVSDVLPKTKKARTTQRLYPIVMDECIREDEDQHIVHPEYRLKRTSFDGRNHTLGMSKHDRDSQGDVLQVAPYVADMFQHHYALEGRTRPRPFMNEQNDINSKMRAILVDWLVEVHMKFRLVPETLFLCINIIDRYCSQVKVRRAKLQLVGVTALLIACKYEEIYPPEVRDCVYITDSAYQREEVLDMEQDIVHKLGFRITVPTAYPFLQRFLKLLKATPHVRHAASYYTERTLQEHDMLRYRPSLICASAVVLAYNNPDIQKIYETNKEINEWPHMPLILLEYTGFTKLEIIDCAGNIAVKVSEEPVTASRRQLVAVKRKYDNKKYLNVSTEIGLPTIATKANRGT